MLVYRQFNCYFFSFFINSIYLRLIYEKFILYADDLKIFYKLRLLMDFKLLQNELYIFSDQVYVIIHVMTIFVICIIYKISVWHKKNNNNNSQCYLLVIILFHRRQLLTKARCSGTKFKHSYILCFSIYFIILSHFVTNIIIAVQIYICLRFIFCNLPILVDKHLHCIHRKIYFIHDEYLINYKLPSYVFFFFFLLDELYYLHENYFILDEEITIKLISFKF